MCWKEMVDKFDVEETQGKKDYCEKTQFDSQGRPLHRPDRDSGLDTPGCREYHIYFDKDGKVESDQNRAAMAGDRQLEDAEDRKEVKEQLEDMVQAFGYNCSAPSAAAAATTQPPGTAAAAVVKIEPGTMASSSTGAEKGEMTIWGCAPDGMSRDQKLANTLMEDPKKVVTNLSDTLMTAKEVYTATKETEKDIRGTKCQREPS